MLRFFTRKKEEKKSLLASDKSKTARFHPLKVIDVRRETSDSVSIAFEVPEDHQKDYLFLPGQYLTLRAMINGEDVRRSYSICSSPDSGEVRVAVKRLPDGVFSTYANDQLKPGDTIDVMTPMGNFVARCSAENEKTYVAFAAGSGITPVMSIMQSVLEKEPKSSFYLFYGNRASNSIIFKEAIEDLKDQYMDRLEVHHVLSREDQGSDLMKGRIDKDRVKAFAGRFFDLKKVDDFFVCGPEGMIHDVTEALEDLGISKERVHYELFTPAKKPDVKEHKHSSKESEVLSQVTVILDGDETHFEISSKGKTILDSALDAGADVPFACKGAVCCTCRAKVLEGEVEMEMNYALVDEEVDEGYVLTCQSHPKTKKVVVSYDE